MFEKKVIIKCDAKKCEYYENGICTSNIIYIDEYRRCNKKYREFVVAEVNDNNSKPSFCLNIKEKELLTI